MNPPDGANGGEQRARMAIPRFGKADDVIALAAFVACPERQSITGADPTIDGVTNI